jgi:hypothetical protein
LDEATEEEETFLKATQDYKGCVFMNFHKTSGLQKRQYKLDKHLPF